MQFINISPQGALDIPMLGRIIEAGEEFEVTDEEAEFLLGQDELFEPVLTEAQRKARDAAADAAAKAAADAEAKAAAPQDDPSTATTEGDKR